MATPLGLAVTSRRKCFAAKALLPGPRQGKARAARKLLLAERYGRRCATDAETSVA
jgi:hypothetical protein